MEASERETRDRLGACLAKLKRLRPDDLVREDVLGQELCFRAGLSYFTRTLELYRRITPRDCAKAPAEYLKIVTTHAEDALQRFEEILSFNPNGMENPHAVRTSLIEEVRAAYPGAYEDVALIIRPLRGQPERVPRQISGHMALALIGVVVIGLLIGAHHYLVYNLLSDLRETLDRIVQHH